MRVFWDHSQWFWVTATTALLAELIFCAKHDRTFREVSELPVDRDLAVPMRALYMVRNVAFHPAHIAGSNAGEPHVLRLVAHLEGNQEGPLGAQLKDNWAEFGGRPLAAFAVRMLESAVKQDHDAGAVVRRRA